jgi:hypothetical protein
LIKTIIFIYLNHAHILITVKYHKLCLSLSPKQLGAKMHIQGPILDELRPRRPPPARSPELRGPIATFYFFPGFES